MFEDNFNKELDSLRNQLINTVITVVFLFALPVLLFSLYRAITEPWAIMHSLHIVIGVYVSIVFGLRKTLKQRTKALLVYYLF